MNTSLLLDLKHTSKVGFFSVFVYGQYIAEKNSFPFEPAVIGDSSLLLKALEILNLDKVKPRYYDSSSRQIISCLINKLLTTGVLRISKRDVLSCSCKKVYIPADAVLRKTSTTLVVDGIATCCNSPLTEETCEVIQTVPVSFSGIEVNSCPYWGNIELTDMRKNFVDKQIVVSRITPTDITINFEDRDFFIDNDMFVYLLPMVDDISPSHLIAGTSLVKHVTLYTFFASQLGCASKLPMIHFLPRVNYKGSKDLLGLCKKFGSDRLRRKLLFVAQSEKQSIAFDDSGI